MDNPLGNNYNTNWSKWWYANKRVPGSEFLGKRSSGPSVQELQELEKRVPGSEFLGKELNFYHLAIRKSKEENILKGSLDLIQSPSPSVKIQIICEKVNLR